MAARAVRLPAFAKVNLCLHALGRRPDGYHELRTIFQSISLHDELRLEPLRGRSIELAVQPNVELSRADLAALGRRDNLAWRAVERLRRELSIRSGVLIELTKTIPVGRGLGGGSSDAAAALLGYLRMTGRRMPRARLLEIASGLGADVGFFFFGGRALGVGRGDEVYPLADGPRRAVLLISPADIAVSTREAYGWLARWLTKRRSAHKLSRFCALCWNPQESRLANDFEAVVFRRHPRLARIKRALLRHGAAEAALAGSGSAVFGVFPNPAQARRAAQGFLRDSVFVAEMISRDEYRRASRLAGTA
jgi:4-diphosphocytidyl-2-C-methyl-D-erythritol kinase